MSHLKDGNNESDNDTSQEAGNDFNNADFGFNVSHDDGIQEIINHRESNNKDGEQTVAKMSDSEPKADWNACNKNEAAKVAKPADMEPKQHSKHNADRTMDNKNE